MGGKFGAESCKEEPKKGMTRPAFNRLIAREMRPIVLKGKDSGHKFDAWHKVPWSQSLCGRRAAVFHSISPSTLGHLSLYTILCF